MTQLYSNNASAVLIEDLQPTDTQINLGPGAGDNFPLPDDGDPDSFCMVTLEDVQGNIEICEMPSRSGDILQIIRGQEDTAPAGFAIGSRVECRLTAGSLQNFKQVADQLSLRGGEIDSDGVKFWHQNDPSTYQFYRIRYYTADLFGIPIMHIEPPASLPGLHVMAGVIGSDGAQRVIRLGSDYAGNAPAPATGEVHFEVPAIMRWSHLTKPFGGSTMYASWAVSERATGDELKYETEGTAEVSYTFWARDSDGVDNYAGVESDGSVSVSSAVNYRSPYTSTYAEALDIKVRNIINPFDPGGMDILQFYTTKDDPKRELVYNFNTIEKIDGVGGAEATYKVGTVNIIYGGITVSEDPHSDDAVTRKSWVQQSIANAVTGTGLDGIADRLYGRTVLYGSAGTNDGSVQTLLGGAEFSDFYEIEITSKAGDIFYILRLDVGSLLNNGYAPTSYAVAQAEGTGGDVRKVYFNPLSLTTFSGTTAGSASGGITSIVGIGLVTQPVT